MRGIIILASCQHKVIRVQEKLTQHPSNNISITQHTQTHTHIHTQVPKSGLVQDGCAKEKSKKSQGFWDILS